jgi:alkylation response protein AidB-like acyl-CoA dehydrogenase
MAGEKLAGIQDDVILSKRSDINAFRSALRDWLKIHVPRGWENQLVSNFKDAWVPLQRDWLGKLQTVGLDVPHWPVQWGGPGFSIPQQVVISEELARANAPMLMLFMISHYNLPATLHAWGTPAQIARYVPQARSGEVWAQGFSEPNAGSDLASLRTRAERRGDRFVINGQKVWSSGATHASLYMLLARTDSSVSKHAGISMFIVDLRSKGVDIRPIRQINGNEEFCEVFLDEVEVPLENLVGPENEGWRVAQSTLSTERGLLIFNYSERVQLLCERILHRVRDGGEQWFNDDQWRREFVQSYTELQGLRAMIRNMLENLERTGEVGDTPPIIKLHYSELQQRFTELFLRIAGVKGQRLHISNIVGSYAKGNWYHDYLSSWVWTISGGTNEIIRNIVAERILGLPKEPKT